MKIFSGTANPELGVAICMHLKVQMCNAEVLRFPDKETHIRILDDVRGTHVFIIQPTTPPANHYLMELLIMVDAIRRASAAKITAVLPYYGYARQDRKHEGRVPITAKLVANLLTTAGVDRVLCMDLHATQIQGFFDIPVDHLQAQKVFVEYLQHKNYESPVVMSPDIGSIKMADNIARRLGGDLAVVQKRRIDERTVEADYVIGNIRDRDVIIVDDIISTGGSMAQAVHAARAHGARSISVLATHGLFVGEAIERLNDAKPDEIVITNTVRLRRGIEKNLPMLKQLSVAPLLAEAIRQIYFNRSISLLF